MTNQKYNGWSNYETWLAALWIDEMYYDYRRELTAQVKQQYHDDKGKQTYKLSDTLKDFIEELNPLTETGFFTDLIRSALSQINWDEIATNYLSE